MSAVPELRPVSVVIVDDTADLRELLRFALERHEFTVVAEAVDGRQGLAAVAEHGPDLVLLDLAMPVMDGFEALPRMRRTCPEAKIVVLSGFDAGAMAARAQDLGADGYLQKGASLTSMIGYVRDVLGPQSQGAPAPPLVVVPPPTATTWTPAPRRTLPAWLATVPFGVVRVADDADLTLLEASHASAGLLGVPMREGEPLAATSIDLADLVAAHRGEEPVHLRLPAPGVAPGDEAHVTLSVDEGELVLVVTALPQSTERLRALVDATRPRGHVPPRGATVSVLHRSPDSPPQGADRARHTRLLDGLLRQAVRLDPVTADLLAASLHSRGLLAASPRACRLRDVLADLVEGRAVTLHGRVEGEVVVDPDLLSLLLGDLLRNAAAYGAPPVELHVDPGGADGGWLRLAVVDHGEGLPLPVATRLFAGPARLTEGAGHGLGLHVVHALSEVLGGRVVHVADPGVTRLEVHLPIPPDDGRGPAAR